MVAHISIPARLTCLIYNHRTNFQALIQRVQGKTATFVFLETFSLWRPDCSDTTHCKAAPYAPVRLNGNHTIWGRVEVDTVLEQRATLSPSRIFYDSWIQIISTRSQRRSQTQLLKHLPRIFILYCSYGISPCLFSMGASFSTSPM